MKKLLVVLLSLGLIVAFCATATAQPTVKFGGSYYLVGVYEDNTTLQPKETAGYSAYSHAFFYQRIRLQPVFQIAEGLTFTARVDAMEKQWGQSDWKGGLDDQTATRGNTNTKFPRRGIQESMEWERGYVTFMTKIGAFQVGYQNVDDWGTDYSDFSNSRPRFAFMTQAGPVELAFIYEKVFEADTNSQGISNSAADADADTYALAATYKGKGMEAGLLLKYYANNYTRPAGAKSAFTQVSPYMKATFGPVYIESELQYWFGKAAEFEQPAGFPVATLPKDIDLKAWGAYVKARFNFGPAYAGALFSYASGNDMSDDGETTTKPGGAGTNFAPAFLLMNDAMASWTMSGSVSATTVGAFNASVNNPTSNKSNTLIYNAFVGVNPTPKLNIEAALTYATVDADALSKNATTGIITKADSKDLGIELDVKATYKIFDNLSYMIGAGYLWTGDYFKGYTAPGTAEKQIEDNFILINQLTLSF